jgi:hypothetical protein
MSVCAFPFPTSSEVVKRKKEPPSEYATITTTEDSPLAPRFEERHVCREKCKEIKKNSAKKDVTKGGSKKEEVR